MTKVVRLLSVAVIAFSLTACGKSKEEKAQDRAQADVEEQNRLANEINASGVPSSSWSEESLARLENKLLQLEQVESRLASANGNNGVTVYGGNNGRLISRIRQRIADARAEKARAQAPRTFPTVSGSSKADILSDRLNRASNENLRLQSQLADCEFVKIVDSSAPKVRRCIEVTERMEANITETRQIHTEILADNSLWALHFKARTAIEKADTILQNLNSQKSLLKTLLRTKEAAS